MTELTIASDVLTLVITLLSSLGATLPFIAKFKSKLAQTKALIFSIESALEDDKVTIQELKGILRISNEIIGKKKK